ncbi:MAG: T9SS C-terminal target domain-containing protein [Calditrichaeota bacterium]|nr:MAG: T9SS C-terminal target domain-containing protein [Calditrichota bacterium]
MQDTSDYATAERWEGVLVKIENVTVVNDNFDNFSSWVVEDENGNQVVISADSDSMRTANDTRGTGNVDPSAAFVIPPVGTKLDAIIGHVDTRFGANTINPRFPSQDIVFGKRLPPGFQSQSRTPAAPTSSDEVQVFVEVNDVDGTIASVKLSYNVDGGDFMELDMTPTAGDSFTATIPAQPDGAVITYYITATDNDNLSTLSPTGAPDKNRYLYHVRDNGLLISDIQQSPFGEKSPYENLKVSVTGITVSDSLDFRSRFYIQQGSGAWNGLMVSLSGTAPVARGDSVTVWGEIQERFGLTQIRIDSMKVLSSGHEVPAPVDVKTGDIATGSDMAESYESVLVRVSNVTVTDPNPDAPSTFGEWVVDDGSGGVRVDDRGRYTYTTTDSASSDFLPTGATIGSLTGCLDFSFGDFKMQPRDNNDFVDVVTGIEYEASVPEDFELMQNYPNPFNPETTIQYRLPAAQTVTLSVYNIMGQRVVNLVDGLQPAGVYRVTWDGKNQFGRSVPSGVYFYKIKAGTFEARKKMLLLK